MSDAIPDSRGAPLSPAEITEAERLLALLPEEPWLIAGSGVSVDAGPTRIRMEAAGDKMMRQAIAAFISKARGWLPRLIAHTKLRAVDAFLAQAAGPRVVLVESPYAGNVDKNVRYARAALRDCLLRGEAPIASHLLYTQEGVLDDLIPGERQIGMKAGFALARVAHATVVYRDLGMSSGMSSGIAQAIQAGRTVEYRSLPDWAPADLPAPPSPPSGRMVGADRRGR